MQIKKDLLLHMQSNHPDFKFAWAKSIFYNFRRVHDDGLYDCIFFQRDGKAGGLAVEIASTYDPLWEGAGTSPIGRNTGLEYLKFGRTHAIEVELIWYFYRNSKSQLNIVLAEISGDLRTHAMDFFARSAQKLRSDELLQYGLALVRRWKPLDESVRLQLETDWRAGHPKINPLFEKLEADLREFATDADLPTENVRTYTSRLLYNFTRPEWAWENYRF
ncbi:MAG: hypothetical protein ACLP2Y_00870 [Limisphaerales bacterium]